MSISYVESDLRGALEALFYEYDRDHYEVMADGALAVVAKHAAKDKRRMWIDSDGTPRYVEEANHRCLSPDARQTILYALEVCRLQCDSIRHLTPGVSADIDAIANARAELERLP